MAASNRMDADTVGSIVTSCDANNLPGFIGSLK